MVDVLQEKMSIVFIAAQRMLKYLPKKGTTTEDQKVSKTTEIAKTKVRVIGPAVLVRD